MTAYRPHCRNSGSQERPKTGRTGTIALSDGVERLRTPEHTRGQPPAMGLAGTQGRRLRATTPRRDGPLGAATHAPRRHNHGCRRRHKPDEAPPSHTTWSGTVRSRNDSCKRYATPPRTTIADEHGASYRRRRTKSTKNDAQHAFVLANIGAGGWGKRDFATKLTTMSYFDVDGHKVYETAAISRVATRHYRSSAPSPRPSTLR